MKKENEMTWYDVTLYQFNELQKLLEITDDTERVCSIAELLLGEDVTKLPLKEFNEQIKKLSFLSTEITVQNPPKKLEVNGRKYKMDCLLGNISTAQYVDYMNHSKGDKPDMASMLSVFIIPDGHKYNDGYDMIQVIDDINHLPIPIVNNAAFFFARQFNVFMKIFQRYSTKQLKKTNLPKEVKEKLTKVVENSVDLVLFHLS